MHVQPDEPPPGVDIGQRRAELGVDPAWIWVWCQSGCGDIVFIPPDIPLRVRVVCSVTCVRFGGVTFVDQGSPGLT